MSRVVLQRISGTLFVLSLVGLAVQKHGCTPGVVPGILPDRLHVAIVRESGDQDQKLGSLIVQLRNTDLKPHTLDVIDDDQIPGHMQASLAEPLKAFPPPMLALLDPQFGGAIHARKLAADETVASILATVRDYSRD